MSYRAIDCPNCGRQRVLLSGICEKCAWDVDGGNYASITGRCADSPDGQHSCVPGNAIMGGAFEECKYCHADKPAAEPPL